MMAPSKIVSPKTEREIELEKQLADLKTEITQMRLSRQRHSHFAVQMREVVEAAGGRMSKEDFLDDLDGRIADDGGSTSVEVLRKTAMRTQTMQRANICKVVIGCSEDGGSDWEVWGGEAAEALRANDIREVYRVLASFSGGGGA